MRFSPLELCPNWKLNVGKSKKSSIHHEKKKFNKMNLKINTSLIKGEVGSQVLCYICRRDNLTKRNNNKKTLGVD